MPSSALFTVSRRFSDQCAICPQRQINSKTELDESLSWMSLLCIHMMENCRNTKFLEKIFCFGFHGLVFYFFLLEFSAKCPIAKLGVMRVFFMGYVLHSKKFLLFAKLTNSQHAVFDKISKWLPKMIKNRVKTQQMHLEVSFKSKFYY